MGLQVKDWNTWLLLDRIWNSILWARLECDSPRWIRAYLLESCQSSNPWAGRSSTPRARLESNSSSLVRFQLLELGPSLAHQARLESEIGFVSCSFDYNNYNQKSSVNIQGTMPFLQPKEIILFFFSMFSLLLPYQNHYPYKLVCIVFFNNFYYLLSNLR